MRNCVAHIPHRQGFSMQINVGSFLSQSTEERISAELLKAYGLTGTGFENLSLMDIFGAPGHSAVGTSALRDVEQMRGWNFTAVVAKSLQFSIGNMAVFCPQWMAEAIAEKYGEEYKASKRVTGVEQYNVPEDWVTAPRQHRIAKLMNEPNPWTDQSTFFLQIAFQTDIHGVAYVLVLPNSAGLPTEMWVIPKAAVTPQAPTWDFPEGSFRIGHLSKLSINTYGDDKDARTLQERLAQISNRQYSARYIIPLGLSSPLFLDDYLNPSSAISDTLDTDSTLHRTRRNAMEKLMTNGPQLEPLPGVSISNSQWAKIFEEFESQNMGPANAGNSWKSPQGVKVVHSGPTGREMEFVNSADQSRDHTLGQRLLSSAMLGLGSGGSYAQVIGLIKGNARLVLQPMMRIFAGQLRIGLRPFFEPPQDQFTLIMQAASIDDPETRLKEWGFLKDSGAVKKGEVRSAFNMAPFGDEEDEKLAGAKDSAGGFDPYADPYAQDPYAQEPMAADDSGQPETPGVGMPETVDSQTTAALKTASITPLARSTMSRREFMRHYKNIQDVVSKYKDGVMNEKTAILMLETLGLESAKAQEFIDSVKDPGAEQSMSTAENNTTASALFARAAQIRGGSFKSIIDQQAQTAATFPGNDLRQPTDRQAHAGQYRKGKVSLCGMQIEIENPVGSIRSGKRPDGTRWAVEMQDHYGYVLGATGFDKDQLDVFIKYGTQPDFMGPVFVINQTNADGSFDEHKCFIGCVDKLEAVRRYLDNYDDEWSDRIMSVAELSLPEFKIWMLDPHNGPMAGPLVTAEMMETPASVYDGFDKSAKTQDAGFSRAISQQDLHDASLRYVDGDYDDPEEKAGLIADILTSIYGDEAEALLSDGDDMETLKAAFSKSFGGSTMFKEAGRTGRRRRTGANGEIVDGDGDGVINDGTPQERPAGVRQPQAPVRRSRARNSPERIAQIHGQVEAALRGERSPTSVKALTEALSDLTVRQLHELKSKYKMSASGATKKDLIAKIAKRLDSGRRADQSAQPVRPQAPAPAQPVRPQAPSQPVVQQPSPRQQYEERQRRNQMQEEAHRQASEDAQRSSTRFMGITNDRDITDMVYRGLANETVGQDDVDMMFDIVRPDQHDALAALINERRPQATPFVTRTVNNMAAERAETQARIAERNLNNTMLEDGSNRDRLFREATEAVNRNLDAERMHAIAGNSEAAQRHKQRAETFRTIAARNQTTPEERERQIESTVLTHLQNNQNATMRDLATATQVEPGDRQNPLGSPLNRVLARLQQEGKISVQDRQFGGPLFSVPRQQPAQPAATNAAADRLQKLRQNLPPKFVLAQDENGNDVLVSPNDRARKLDADPAKQVRQIEDQLRRRGFDPEQVIAGNTRPQPRQKPAAAATAAAAPPAPAQPSPQPAATAGQAPRMTPQQKATALRKIGADFLDDIEPGPDGNLVTARPESKGMVVYSLGQSPRSWEEISADDRASIESRYRAEQREKIKKDESWKAVIRETAKQEVRQTIDATMPGASPEEKAQAVAAQVKRLMNGRSSWFKQQATAELNRRASDTAGMYYWANGRGLIGASSEPKMDAALAQFGFKKQDLASIIGLPDDWTVRASASQNMDGTYSIHLNVQNDLARMNRSITMQDGKPHLYNSSFFAKRSAPKGLGLDIFSKSVANAKRLGFGMIETMPCRSSGRDGMVGYAVWPQFGYDAPLTQVASRVANMARSRFPGVETVRDIFDQPGGQEWWWENGDSISRATFKLEDNSRNMKALQAYMSKKRTARAKVRGVA